MTTKTDTARVLAEMSDVGAFERIAAAVLRAANPPIYANVSHPGVQPGGKTVKAPFDNIGWVQSASGPRFVCAAHTTEQKDLTGKWLHDPANVKPRKAGGKPTKPAGDLIKGIEEITQLRESRPSLAVTFALTTNREPSLDLLAKIEGKARTAGIDLDVWSVSRISDFLDTNPVGQIIRRNHLGIPVKYLSRDLLLEIGKRSIHDHLPHALAGDSIRRDDFSLGNNDTLVVGSAGMGKTTACAAELHVHLEKKLPAIVLKMEFLATATTMEAAIESELRRQEPELELSAAGKALSLCSREEPMLVLIEDLNRADNPELLLNKVLSWTSGPERPWRAICPIWPRYVDVIEDKKRVFAALTVRHVDKYTSIEAIRAIRKRADILGITLDEHRANSITDRLGLDPLLIGIYDLTSGDDAQVGIQTYVSERLSIVAARTQCIKSELVQALNQLLLSMLQHRNLSPKWMEVTSWIVDQDIIARLKHIAREGSLMRISDVSGDEAIKFRHDRVMYSQLGEAIAVVLKTDALPDYVTDPFFSEVVAGAIVQVQLPLQKLVHLMGETPATAAHALRLASDLGTTYTITAALALLQWLQREDVKSEHYSNQRYAVAGVLAETTDPHVRQLIQHFPTHDFPWYPLFAAAFRNGDLRAGLQLLSMHELGVTIAGKQGLIALVKRMYGRELVAGVEEFLRFADLNNIFQASILSGALRLAGYLGDSSLAQAVRTCWDRDERKQDHLRSYLFAAARCCGDAPEATLGPVCDAWEALPEDSDSKIGQPAERLASENVAWEFRYYTPVSAVRYLVERANTSGKIEWPITYMLRTVDHPDAIEHVARCAAKLGYINARSLRSDWERHWRESRRRMSPESRDRLLRFSLDEDESKDTRKHMFDFWALALDEGDLSILRQISETSVLYERALWARSRLQDRSVIPALVRKIPEDPEYWLQISRYLWSDALTAALDPLLDQIAEKEGEGFTNLEYAVAEALDRGDPLRVISMLRSRWMKLMKKPLMVQVILLSTIPEALNLVREAFSTSTNQSGLVEHFVTNVSVFSNGKVKLSDSAQLNNLKPYIALFSDEDIESLWDLCTKKGWLDFRDKYLEPRLQKIENLSAGLIEDPTDVKYLDQALHATEGEIVNLYPWLNRPLSRQGKVRTKLVDEMVEWLDRNKEERALAIVGGIMSREATRQEFRRFEATAALHSGAAPIVNAVRFDVFSRSLA